MTLRAATRLSKFFAAIGILALACVLKIGATEQARGLTVGAIAQNPEEFPIAPFQPLPRGSETIVKASETNDIRVTLSMDRICSIKGGISIHLTLKNCRNEDIFLNHCNNAADFYLYLADSDGKPVPRTEFGDNMLSRALYSQFNNTVLTLRPGGSMERNSDLMKYFAISHAGVYKLAVLRTVRGTSSMPDLGSLFDVQVNAIIFGVN